MIAKRNISIESIATDLEIMRARCDALVISLVGRKMADKWWTGPNKAFGGETPEQMYREAPNDVYAYLMKSAEGEW